jgi:hypothetical protein
MEKVEDTNDSVERKSRRIEAGAKWMPCNDCAVTVDVMEMVL